MNTKTLQQLGLMLLIPMMAFAVYANDGWAEPLPEPITPAFDVTIEPKKEEAQMDYRAEYERELMARVVEAEAGNQSLLGKRMVAAVILNRVDHPSFPDSIKGVIYQAGQFTTVTNGRIYTVSPSEETREAVKMELEDRTETSVIYFNAGKYSAYGEPYEKVGDHYFSK